MTESKRVLKQSFEAASETLTDVRQLVIEHCFRHHSVKRLFSKLPYSVSFAISSNTGLPINAVNNQLVKAINAIKHFVKFLRSIPLSYDPKKRFLKARVYLHKIHKIAPVFNYTRARENLKRLQSCLKTINYYPQLGTQLAFTIYVTDLKDTSEFRKDKLIQANVKTLCACSSYAYHRLKHKIHFN
ncbi:MAG: hypothetical protein GF383_01750 [Candidatus Lokiarchaeota archaeon]|nr:hypothetical protein [Candidatus Lokiarchaeota archaeon]MBD3338034.1 hypothetical protein [Candidatus Lokiarchaeota archaeon]